MRCYLKNLCLLLYTYCPIDINATKQAPTLPAIMMALMPAKKRINNDQ